MSKSDEQIQKESSRRIAREAAKAFPDFATRSRGIADWSNANPAVVLGLVCAVAAREGAVRYGYTRDGGAYSIGIYQGDLSKTYYCNEKDGIDEFLTELKTYFEK